MTLETPVLLIAWRRPQTTKQVLDAIRVAAPRRLYVACDGPAPGNAPQADLVAATRALIDEEIDWPCEVFRRYSDSNQGCRIGVSSAISWFFEREPEGIILEDDCVPHPDFFPYCEQLLDRYRNDTRIWMISGNNFQDGQWRGDGSYYFSVYPHIWGWATWRRTWAEYDRDLDSWPKLRETSLAKHLVSDPKYMRKLAQRWDNLREKREPDTWDYQFSYSGLVSSRLSILPNRTLVANIGFGSDATHTIHEGSYSSHADGLSPIMHPSFVLRDFEADEYTRLRLDPPRRGLPVRVAGRLRRFCLDAWTRLRNTGPGRGQTSSTAGTLVNQSR